MRPVEGFFTEANNPKHHVELVKNIDEEKSFIVENNPKDRVGSVNIDEEESFIVDNNPKHRVGSVNIDEEESFQFVDNNPIHRVGSVNIDKGESFIVDNNPKDRVGHMDIDKEYESSSPFSWTTPWMTSSTSMQWVTGKYVYMSVQDQTVEYWKQLLGASEYGHPSLDTVSDAVILKLLPNGTAVTKVDALVAVTSNLRTYQPGFSSQIFGPQNLLDGNYETLFSISGTENQLPWISIYMPTLTFVRGVRLSFPTLPGEEPVNHEEVHYSVQLQWMTYIEYCQNSIFEGGKSAYVQCGDFLSDVVFIQIDKAWKAMPYTLTLSEIVVEGMVTQQSRIAKHSQELKLYRSTILNVVNTDASAKKRNDRSFFDQKNKNSRTCKTFAFTLSGPYSFITTSKTGAILCGRKGAYLHVENCPSFDLDINLISSSPCLEAYDMNKCSWTIAFLDSEVYVYFDSVVVGRSLWDLSSCPDSDASCMSCKKVLGSTNFITNKDTDNWKLSTLDVNDHLKVEKEITSKLDRHDECFASELFLAENCESVVAWEQYMEFTNNTKQYGFELLNMSLTLQDILLNEYIQIFVTDIVHEITSVIENNFLSSQEYHDLVRSESTKLRDTVNFLDEMWLMQEVELDGHREIVFFQKLLLFEQLVMDDTHDFFNILEECIFHISTPLLVSKGTEIDDWGYEAKKGVTVTEEKINRVFSVWSVGLAENVTLSISDNVPTDPLVPDEKVTEDGPSKVSIDASMGFIESFIEIL